MIKLIQSSLRFSAYLKEKRTLPIRFLSKLFPLLFLKQLEVYPGEKIIYYSLEWNKEVIMEGTRD